MMTPEDIRRRVAGTLVEHLGVEFERVVSGSSRASISVMPHHLAPNGYLHGGVVVALADSCCGFGCIASLPPEAKNFTTVELKTNFLGTATSGRIRCNATLSHAGRSTQVWDAVVVAEGGKDIALFRCTQLLLYTGASSTGRTQPNGA